MASPLIFIFFLLVTCGWARVLKIVRPIAFQRTRALPVRLPIRLVFSSINFKRLALFTSATLVLRKGSVFFIPTVYIVGHVIAFNYISVCIYIYIYIYI